MSVDGTADREADWRELEALLVRARRRPQRLGVDGVLRLGALYRAAAADLALARATRPRAPATRRLALLVGRARSVIYDSQPRPQALRAYVTRGYWRDVRAHARPIVWAWSLMIVATVLAYAWAVRDPANAASLLPAEFSAAGRPSAQAAQLSPATSAALSSAIFTNNIRVTLLAFAGGIFAGIVTAALLVYNGVILGVVTGLSADNGRLGVAIELLTPHGVLELSCIAVTSAAGARIGWALVDPGPRSRITALVDTARSSVGLVLGTAPWLVLAGLVEGFVTPERIGVAPAVVLGCALAGLYWGLVVVLGRRKPVEGVVSAGPG